MAKFEKKESYLHLTAKELLYSWLNQLDKTQDSCSLSPIGWRSNYGVFMELPFHETDDPYYFECSAGLRSDIEIDERYKLPYSEWFDMSFDRGKILFAPDITIFHKGTPKILIEIIFTNRVSEKKYEAISKFFHGHHVQVFEISAFDILRNTEIPKQIKILNLTEF